jgi:hypothetical protein
MMREKDQWRVEQAIERCGTVMEDSSSSKIKTLVMAYFQVLLINIVAFAHYVSCPLECSLCSQKEEED